MQPVTPMDSRSPAAMSELLRSIVVHANDVVLVTEAEPVDLASGGPKVIYVNPAFTRMTGYAPADIIGLTPRVLQSPKTDQRELDRLRVALRRWQPVEVELLNVHKDGTEFWVQINITPVCDETGWWTHWVAIQRDVTARKHRELAVQAMLESSSDLMLLLDDDGGIVNVSPSAATVLLIEPEALVGRSIPDLVHPDDRRQLATIIEPPAGVRAGRTATADVRLRRGDESWVDVEVTASALGTEGTATVLTCADITLRKRTEALLQTVNDRFRSAFDDAPIGMAVTEPTGRIIQVNAALVDLLGYPEPVLLTMSIQDITHPDDVEPGRRQRAELVTGTATRHRHETRFVNAAREIVGVLHSSSIVPAGDGPPHLIDHIEDITERKAFETDLLHQALHDTLTGLPTRALLIDRLQQVLGASLRTDATVAVIFLDLDRFKLVNDTLGHQAGDEVLTTVATRLTSALRPGDTAARFSGDEFVVLCDQSSPERAAAAAARLAEVLSRPMTVGGTEITVAASIGIALSRPGFGTPESLLQEADAAMYSAKHAGRGRIEVFDDSLGAKIQARLQLETELRGAITADELRLHYQPEIDLASGRTVGLEALVRWQHPRLGLLAPAEFIGMAEDSGLISALGDWVLDEALGEAARRRDHAPDVIMWVNLSAVQISDPRLTGTVKAALARHHLPGSALGLEITESVLMRDFESSRMILTELKALGISLAMDDFGTGYSSLSYLARFPIDTIKIDRYFTSGLDDPERRRESFAIIGAVIGLAHAFTLRVVAEGIETATQSQTLHGLGCDHGQGYLLALPEPGHLFHHDHR